MFSLCNKPNKLVWNLSLTLWQKYSKYIGLSNFSCIPNQKFICQALSKYAKFFKFGTHITIPFIPVSSTAVHYEFSFNISNLALFPSRIIDQINKVVTSVWYMHSLALCNSATVWDGTEEMARQAEMSRNEQRLSIVIWTRFRDSSRGDTFSQISVSKVTGLVSVSKATFLGHKPIVLSSAGFRGALER